MQREYRSRIYAKYGKNFQDADGTFDERQARVWGKAYQHYLRGWLPSNKDAKLVDLACGGGRMLQFFKRHGFTRISGVDISPDQVALSKQVTPDIAEQSVLPFLEGRRDTFDLITGLDIVEHFHKPEVIQFLDGCYQSLRSGGRLILQTPNADSPWGTMHRYNDFTHEVCFNPNALSRLMRLSGFGAIEARETGPVPFGYSLSSTLRNVVWQTIRVGLKVWNIAETGSKGSGIFTRVFIITGIKS